MMKYACMYVFRAFTFTSNNELGAKTADQNYYIFFQIMMMFHRDAESMVGTNIGVVAADPQPNRNIYQMGIESVNN
jgi:hypothetical protein